MRRLFGFGLTIAAVVLLFLMGLGNDPQPRSSRQPISSDDPGSSGDPTAAVPSNRPAEAASLNPRHAQRQLEARDLFDKCPLPNLALGVKTADGGAQIVRTDRDGIVKVEEKVVEDAIEWRCESGAYQVASSAEQARRESVVWCVAHNEVRGRVVFEAAPLEGEPVEFEEVSLSVSPEYVTEDELSLSKPGRFGWLQRSAMREHLRMSAHPDETGSFLIRVPRLAGAAVVARARGYRPAWESLDCAALRGERELLLVLKPGYRIEGTAHDQAGAPLTGARVHVYVVIRSSISDFDNSSVGRIRKGGFAVARSVKKDQVIQKLHYGVNVGPSGRWSVDVGADGEAHIACYPDGHAPINLALGRASARQDEVELVSEARSPSRVLIKLDGQALSQQTVMLVDLTYIDVQSNFRVETDASGFLTTPFLERGKSYIFWVLGKGPRFLTYSGQPVVDLAECVSSLDEFLGER